MPRTIEMEPVYTERVTPGRYLKVYKDDSGDIESVRIIAPRVGKRGDLGAIEIKYTHPTYVHKISGKTRSKLKIAGFRVLNFRKKK
jgi:hypothetical protein